MILKKGETFKARTQVGVGVPSSLVQARELPRRLRDLVPPRALRRRCLAHKMRNLQSKLPDDVWPEFHARARACYQAASPALARSCATTSSTTYGCDLPSAVACFNDDFEACIAHLRFPLALGARSAPPTCSSACSARSAAAPR